jgi:DIS3-like exonuclease 1
VKQDYVDHLSMEEMEEGLKSKKFYYGVLRVNKQRFREAYVTVSEFETDILIEDFRNRNRAIHGDIVVIQINEEEKNKHQTGFVVGIKEKKSPSIFAGAIMKEEGKSKGFRWLLPLEKAFPKIMIDYAEFRDFFNTKASNAEDLVIVAEMMPWKVNQHYPKGKLRGNLGIKRDLWAQKRSIMFQAMPQLYDSIYRSKDEEKHSAKIEKVTEIEEFDKNEYEDWRDKCIFTIDPLTSRDLDDAVSVEKIDIETFKCYVVIADVSKFVEEGTTTDLEAQKRGTSVYMVDSVEHMLEPTLSQNLCSLLPGVTRFGVAVNWIMKSNGDVDQKSVEFHRVVMKSCVKLDYDTVQVILFIIQFRNLLMERIHQRNLCSMDSVGRRSRKIV